MESLVPDPFQDSALPAFAERFARGDASSAATTSACLARIAALDPELGAFEYVDAEAALAQARALDAARAAGINLGPLMGVPIAIKDLFAVEGMPTTAGSQVDVSDIIGGEGSFVRRLRRAGCVILGKTKTVEFAFGAVGANAVRGMPRNPWDAAAVRIPGGSSSGSAVAVAAGLCAFAIGSDTGGSVRLPAALCGVFGLKTTVGLWATDGVFPLSPTFDSIGLLTRTAADAALAFAAIEQQPATAAVAVSSLRLAIPRPYFFDGLDREVRACLDKACEALAAAGATFIEKEMAFAREREGFFGPVLATELIASFGRERFIGSRALMDPVVAARTEQGLKLHGVEYVRMIRKHQELKRRADEDMAGIDAWLTPTAAAVPIEAAKLADPQTELALAGSITRNTQPMNLFGQCGVSLPIHGLGSALPVGLQIICPPFAETRALGVALAIETLIGAPPRADVTPFVGRRPVHEH